MSDFTKSATQVNDISSVNQYFDLEPVHKALLRAFNDAMVKHQSAFCSLKIDTFIWKMWDYLKEKFSYWTLRLKIIDLINWGYITKKLNGGKGSKVYFLDKGIEFIKQLTYPLQLNCNSKTFTLLDHSESIKSDQTDNDLVSKLAKKEGLDENQIKAVRAELRDAPKYTKIRKMYGFVKSLVVKAKGELIEMKTKSAEDKQREAQLEATLKQTAIDLVDAHLLKEGIMKPSSDLSTYANPSDFLPAIHAYEQRRDGMINATFNKLRIENGIAKVEKDPKPHNPRYAKPVNVKFKHDWQSEVYG